MRTFPFGRQVGLPWKIALRINPASAQAAIYGDWRLPVARWSAVAIVSAVCGGLVSLVGMPFVILLVGGASAVALLALRPATIVWLLFILVLLVVGQLTFFLGITQAPWIPYLMVLVLVLKLPMEMIYRQPQSAPRQEMGVLVFILICFFIVFAISALINQPGLPSILVASKNYIFVWSLFALIGCGFVDKESLEKLWRFFLWVSVCQFPLAVIERFYFARIWGNLNWDAVVGTFGGNYLMGGGSGMMAFFLVFSMLTASAAYSARFISGAWHWSIILLSLATIAMAEVKVIFIILPLGYLWLYRREFFKHPVQAILWLFGFVAALGIIFAAYRYLNWEHVSSHEMSYQESLDYVLQVESDPNVYDRRTREVSRIGALLRWSKLNPPTDPYRFLLGNGPGASRESETIGSGVAARKYPFMLSTSTASVLLWDVGVVGYFIFLLLLVAGAISADRTARHPSVPREHQPILRANSSALLLAAMLTIYNRDAIDSVAMQFLLAAMLGHTLFLQRRYGNQSNIDSTIHMSGEIAKPMRLT